MIILIIMNAIFVREKGSEELCGFPHNLLFLTCKVLFPTRICGPFISDNTDRCKRRFAPRYVCVGFAYCEKDPADAVYEAISKVGLTSTLDEYKSGARMAGAEHLSNLRDYIYRVVLENCKLGLYIGPTNERPTLLHAAIATAEKITHRKQA